MKNTDPIDPLKDQESEDRIEEKKQTEPIGQQSDSDIQNHQMPITESKPTTSPAIVMRHGLAAKKIRTTAATRGVTRFAMQGIGCFESE